ncbi:MAG: GGDEF domain-containing protein [Pseudomonadota bacterium]
MALDIRTLLVAVTVLELAIFVAMFFFWRTQKTYPGFGHWAMGSLLVLFACLLLGLQGHIPLVLSEVGGNTCFVLTAWLRLTGLRRFLEQPPGRRLEVLYPLLTVAGLTWFLLVEDSWSLRTAVFTLPTVLLGVQCAWLLLRQGTAQLRVLYLANVVAVLLFMAVLVGRASFMLPLHRGASAFMEHPWQYLFFLTGILVEVFWNISFAMMNSSRLAAELMAAQAALARLAATDPLTGVRNRRSLLALGELEVARARRYGHPLTALLLDLDHFKKINDSQGHQAGDRALLAVVDICQAKLRKNDLLGRVGGDEFALLLPETGAEGAMSMAQRLCQGVAELDLSEVGITSSLSLSVGVSLLHAQDQDLDELLQRADQALYRAKQNGRDQVAFQERDPTPGLF